MAVTYLDRFVIPIGRLRKEFIYVNNVVNDDVVKSTLSKIHSVDIRPVNYTGSYAQQVSIDNGTSGGNEIVTIRDPDGVAGTVYEIEINGV